MPTPNKTSIDTRDNQIPITGFERTIHLDLRGIQFAVPYGYLTDTSEQQGQLWLNDETKIHRGGDYFNILVYYRKEKGQWKLQPFNQHTQTDFIQYLTTGLPPPTLLNILIQNQSRGCLIHPTNYLESIIRQGAKKIHSEYPEYIIYEGKTRPTNIEWNEIPYVREENNPAILSQERYDKGGYSVRSFSCLGQIEISYYPFGKQSVPYSQQDIISLHQQVENLIKSFL